MLSHLIRLFATVGHLLNRHHFICAHVPCLGRQIIRTYILLGPLHSAHTGTGTQALNPSISCPSQAIHYFLPSEDQIALKVSLLARWCAETDLKLIQWGKFNRFWVAVLFTANNTASNQIQVKLGQQLTASAPPSHCVWKLLCARDRFNSASAFHPSLHFVRMLPKECLLSL